MNFNKYGSLENHYREGFIQKIIMNGLSEQEFVATEKVHGANFGMWYDGTEHKVSKRSGFTTGEFFTCYKVEKYQPLVEIAYENLVEAGFIESGETMVIFGELFGGNFYGEHADNAKCIQGGMNYHPDVEFVAYDVGLESLDGSKSYITYDEFLDYLPDELPTVPEIKRGKLLELLELDNALRTRIPAMFGLEVPEGKELNVAEGLVIKPTGKDMWLPNGSRIIIKSKNDLFSEVSRSKSVKLPQVLSDEATVVSDYFMLYLNHNRVANVASHEGEVTWKGFVRLSGLTFQDAITEYNKETGFDIKEQIGDEWKTFYRIANGVCQEVTRNYIKSVL